MRSHRIPAAAAATLLSLGLGAGTASATAATSPSPSASPSASASASPSASTSASTSATPQQPIDYACYKGIQSHTELDTKVTGFPATLARGGAPVESTVTFRNSTGRDVQGFDTAFYVGYADGLWPAGSFTVQVKLPGGDWKAGSFGAGDLDHIIDTGRYQLAKDETLTVKFRLAATDKAPLGEYGGSQSGGSDVVDDDTGKYLPKDAPAPAVPGGKGTCTQYVGYGDFYFTVVDPKAATPTAAPSKKPVVNTRPSAKPTKKATPSASAGTPTATKSAGPELAATGGGSSSLPLAVGGGAAVLLGAGVLVALRRRGKRA
ncbi:LPXTG cell wall anchor domain-containing protein [Kitasatospora sp. NPDC096147]|uniref:LPXTG cell wall anchor domain-containing protein n=1 Tax=Kitasatospora sp. NPDC096147 TaxID=3364093 RepID=UPI0038180AC6